MTKERILERAKEIMKREKVDAEKAWALAVAELTLEELKTEEAKENQEKELTGLIGQGKQVIKEMRDIKDNLEREANE